MATKEFQINEILEFQRKSHRKAGDGLESGSYPFFTSSQSQTKWLDEADYKFEAIILGTGGAPSVHCAKNFSTSADVFILAPKAKYISVKYVYFYLRGNKDMLARGFKGAGLKHLSRNYTGKMKVPVPIDSKGNPDIKEQERIVALLEEAEELKQKRAEADQKMTTVANAMFFALLQKHSDVIEKGTFDDFEIEIVDGDRGKNYPKRHEFQQKGYCLFLNTKNIVNGEFVFSRADFVSKERHVLLGTGEVKQGDIVMTTRGTVGNTAYFDKNISCGAVRINSGMVIFRGSEKHFNPSFLHFYLTSDLFRNQYLKKGSGSAQPQLPIKDLRRMGLIKLPRSIQNRFADLLSEVLVIKDKQKWLTENINGLFTSLLSKSFNR